MNFKTKPRDASREASGKRKNKKEMKEQVSGQATCKAVSRKAYADTTITVHPNSQTSLLRQP